jgi:predicted  nucleic acid-binding Zn-ribbon protein
VKADPAAQRRLLELQAIDTTLNQLAHRRRTLPQVAELDRLAKVIDTADGERIKAQMAVDDLDRDIARMEKDVDQVRVRKNKDQSRLDAGTGPARELEALQHELASLSRRQSELEDAELELMEQREEAGSALSGTAATVSEARDRYAAVEAERDKALADIAKDEEFRRSGRAPLVADLPADLIALYDRIRESSGGVGAALLRAGRCEGCRIELFGSELSAVRSAPADEVVRCEECRRILVRTAESGL